MKTRIAFFVMALAMVSLLIGSAQVGANQPTAPASAPTLTQAQIEAKIEPMLLDQLRSNSDGNVRYMVYLSEQADTSNSISPLQWKQKGDYVYNKLREVANRTQPGIRAQLASLTSQGKVGKVESFYITNGFYVEATADTAYTIAARPDVASLNAVRTYHITDQLQAAPALQAAPIAPTTVITDYGITIINAPQVWAQGYLGQGVTIGDIDTGVQYDHPAIQPHWRGTYALPGMNYNWYDAVNHQPVAYDDNSHGTHTAGTTVGVDAAGQNVIGVAPKATLIACKGLDNGQLGGDVNELLHCAEWMLAPTDVNGNDPRPELRPNVINNSWGGADGSDNNFQYPIQQWINAGIFPSFANGNSGPGPSTVGNPGSSPLAFGAGATDNTDQIAGFSSRGPSPVDGSVKPNISAPGVNIRSSIPTNQYANFSGTSMASPHVVGVVALLLSKNRTLTVDQLKNVITSTAYFTSFMGTRPNNNYGWGRIDALAGANSVPADSGTVMGHVTDGSNPIAGAYIVLTMTAGLPNFYGVSDATGAYTITVPSGADQIGARKFGYTEQDVSINVTNGMTVTQDFTLPLAAAGSLSGVIQLASNNSPISGTLLVGAPGYTPTLYTGSYNINIPNGAYTVTLRPSDNCLAPQTAVVQVNGATTHDFLISQKTDGFGYSCQTATLSNYITAANVVAGWARPPFPPNNNTNPRDDGVVTTTLPFSFHFYGNNYNQIHLGTNGLAFFSAPNWSESGGLIPYPQLPNAGIYPFWDDLNLDLNNAHHGDVYTDVLGTAPNRQYVIEWRHVIMNVDLASDDNFEILLNETGGGIAMQYQHMVNARGANLQVVGIEDMQGTAGILHSWNIPGAIHDSLVINWIPPTVEPTPTITPTPPPSNTPAATNTPLATTTMTATSTPAATTTMTATNTPSLPTVTPTDCANPFIDITGNIFYTAIHYLNCRGVVNGLDPSHYGPAGTSTRGQFAKVVVLGFGTPLFTPTTQDFVDVPPSYFAYVYIESGFHAGILSGYDPATCAAHGLGTPCYLPNLPITRAQLTKLVVNAGAYTLITPQGGVPDFVDVLPSNVFYVSIETAYHAGIVSGYPGHLYLPNQNIRRDQMAQIVYEGIIHRP